MRPALALLAVLLPSLALAHGDASWIMQEPRFVMKSGVHCCGPTDCGRLPRGAVILTKDGYVVLRTGQVFPREAKDRYDSIDESYWSCQRAPDAPVHCLFTPSLGF